MFKNLTVLEDEKTVKCNDLLERNQKKVGTGKTMIY